MDHVTKVAVIGAGAAGLSAVRILACGDEKNNNNNDCVDDSCEDERIEERGGKGVRGKERRKEEDRRREEEVERGRDERASNGYQVKGRHRFEVIVFEQTDDIGGSWRYSDHVGVDPRGQPVHTSMYKNLRTNIPKECMDFPDFRFPEHLHSYPRHQDVLQYLHDYTNHFGLRKHIQFMTRVEKVKPIPDDSNRFGVRWEVTTSDVSRSNGGQDEHTHLFDAVLVCSGQFSKPQIPSIPGLDGFQGHVIHSHDYRVPDVYRGQKVAVLGGRLSGQDIGTEVASVARKVYLCHDKEPLSTQLPSNMEQKPGIEACHGQTVTFRGGHQTERVDSIVLCTGYQYNFPFLDDTIGLRMEGGRITSLYKHLLSTSFPSLAFVSILKYVIYFRCFYAQLKYFRAILTGAKSLPTKQEMMADEAREFEKKKREGRHKRHTHLLEGGEKFEYQDELARLCGTTVWDSTSQAVYEMSIFHRLTNWVNFRNHRFVVDEDGCVHVDEIVVGAEGEEST